MHPIEDADHHQQYLRALELHQAQTLIVACYKPGQQNGLPFLNNEEVGIKYEPSWSSGRRYDYKTSWGYFKFDNKAWCYYLVEGTPPDSIQEKNRMAFCGTAMVYPDRVVLTTETEPPRVIDLDYQVKKTDIGTGLLHKLDAALAAADVPVTVWRIEFDPSYEKAETIEPMRVSTEHVSMICNAAAVDEGLQMLVAVQFVPPDQQSAKALFATLADNGGKAENWVSIDGAGVSLKTRGPARGYRIVNRSMQSQNVTGTVTCYIHPLCGEPNSWSDPYFFVLTAPGEDLAHELEIRLNKSITWPVQSAWVPYLIEAGRKQGLIHDLRIVGKAFAKGVRVSKSGEKWGAVIAQGLRDNCIAIVV